MGKPRTLGHHIASRLVELGVSDFFSVPGDFNLILLDQFLEEPRLNMIGCCNELNAGYAADGYARAKGVACCVVTFTVGGLSIINAIAGAYSENLPVICIVGGPNSNDYGSNRILHHTIGKHDFSQELRCFEQVTCAQAVVNDLAHAYERIDFAISQAKILSKPVYISVSCNLAGLPHPSFANHPVPYALTPCLSNQRSLEAAINTASEFLNSKVKPVLVAGPKIRCCGSKDQVIHFADSSSYPVAIMPSAKGYFPETHSHFIGTYWGSVSSPFVLEIIESADAYIFAGPIFNDYSSVGYSLLIKPEKSIIVDEDRVTVGGGETFGCVLMSDFLKGLALKIVPNSTAYENFSRIYVPPGVPNHSNEGEVLRVNILFKHIQSILNDNTAIIAETGDSWFNCQKLRLPEHCGYEFQMQYGSIGWSVGATLGYAQAVGKKKRVLSFIGDGSFQVTCQDVSTMIKQGQNPIILLINNGGYTIEVEIHDGPYNVIKNWNYTGLVEALHNGEGLCWTKKVSISRNLHCNQPISSTLLFQVRTESDLVEALHIALEEKSNHLCFLEVVVHKDDTSKELLEWGSRVSEANSRKPQPQ